MQMSVLSTDLVFYLTGGASNTSAAASLGGQISSTAIVNNTLDNIFSDVTAVEAVTGYVDYRCIAVKNNNASTDLTAAAAFIATNCPGADSWDIGIEVPTGTPATTQVVANVTTAPTGITFSRPSTQSTGLTIAGNGDAEGTLGSGTWCGIWCRRTVPAEAATYLSDGATITVGGSTT
jgi:hypothetical protein